MRTTRRVLMLITAQLMLLPAAASAQFLSRFTRSFNPPNFRTPTLQETLEKGLRARRPTEFAFIQRVVDMVNARQLPLDLVRSTFEWARRKRPYPYPYFERALKVRAARQGITVK